MPVADPDIEAIARIAGVQTILKVITQSTGLRLAMVARVTADDWKACAVDDQLGFGLSTGGHLDVATTLCSEVRDARKPIVIEHAAEDAVYCGHLARKTYDFESYVGVPIFLANGEYFGNVCALDRVPLPLRERKAEELMTLFAQLIALQLDARALAAKQEETARLREQFIAVVGHDLRNPLSAILMGAGLLLARGPGAAEQKVLQRIVHSGRRMTRLIDDVLDFARGRLGGGIALNPAQIEVADLNATFEHICDEIQLANPTREIRRRIATTSALHGDWVRLGQLLSNLLANAVTHGTPEAPVHVVIEDGDGALAIAVSNGGEPIDLEAQARLFEPFERGLEAQARTGLGLGLYISSEIVRSHGGTIAVTSTKEAGTTFRCTIPRPT